LIAAYENGDLKPLPVGLPVHRLHKTATTALRVAQDIELHIGLLRRAEDPRPVLYSKSYAATRNGLYDESHGKRILKQLEKRGVVVCVGSTRNGTKLYAPPLGAELPVAVAHRLEPAHGLEVGEEVAGLDPAVEEHQQLAVEGAELVGVPPRGTVGVITTGDRTAKAVRRSHATNGNAASGGQVNDAERAA
jgi:hypothetical protein